MKLKYPHCRFPYDLREAGKDEALTEIIRMQPDFGPHAALIFEYAELFDTTRPIKAAKLLRIFKELREIYSGGRFTYHKRAYRISKKGFAEGLKMLCNKRFTEPLTNHNYLKKVLITIADKEAAGREKALIEKEKRLRAGERPETIPLSQRGTEGNFSIGEAAKELPWRKQ